MCFFHFLQDGKNFGSASRLCREEVLAPVLALSRGKVVIVVRLQTSDERVNLGREDQCHDATSPSSACQPSSERSVFPAQLDEQVQLRMRALVEVGAALVAGEHQLSETFK